MYLSHLKREDQNTIFELLCDAQVMAFIGPRRALNSEEAEEWFLSELLTPSRFVFRDLCNNEVIGFCGVKMIDGENDFGYFIRRKYWGRGYGKLMCKITLEKLAKKGELKSLKIFIANNNIASKKIALSLGWKESSAASNEYEQGHLYQVAVS